MKLKKEFTEEDMIDAFNVGMNLGYENLKHAFYKMMEPAGFPIDTKRFIPFENLIAKKRKII